MSIETTDALVVRTVDFSESSSIVTLFTRDFGKVRGLAKGARRLKNPFETSLDLLASIRVSFIRKKSDALDLLTEAKLVRRFRPTSRNLRGLYAGYYLAETLDAATLDYEPNPELWDLADATLARFQTDDDVPRRLAAYEAGLLDALGEFPSTRFCVECGEELPLDSVKNPDRRVLFAPSEGGVVCARCRVEKNFFELIPTTIAAFRLLEASLALAGGDESAPFEEFSPQGRAAFRDLVGRYLACVLNRRLKTANFMRFIESSRTPKPETPSEPENAEAPAKPFRTSESPEPEESPRPLKSPAPPQPPEPRPSSQEGSSQ
ncbi:MAG: DNA repair protein RecO [Thermoguttaceae bacterium]|nr:DNA repair protein RecO [Thermoguttaceae bacterium]